MHRALPQVNNSSGVPGLRLRVRRTRTGLLRTFIAVSWQERGPDGRPRRAGTDIPTEQGPLRAVERAMRLRMRNAGVRFDVSPRSVWHRLVRALNEQETTP